MNKPNWSPIMPKALCAVFLLMLPIIVGASSDLDPEVVRKISGSAYGKDNPKCIGVSLIQLIANPDKYHGKLVRVIGVTNIEFEGNQIFTSKEHYQYSILKNALWINPDLTALGVREDDLKKCNGKYVLIEGIFNKDETGHMGMNSGGIDKITRFDLWEIKTK